MYEEPADIVLRLGCSGCGSLCREVRVIDSGLVCDGVALGRVAADHSENDTQAHWDTLAEALAAESPDEAAAATYLLFELLAATAESTGALQTTAPHPISKLATGF